MSPVVLPFSVYQYTSSHEFIQDAYEHLHSKDESISYEKFAEVCRIKSRTEARNVIKGTKPCTEATLLAIAAFFGLSTKDSQYLAHLYRFEQAGGTRAGYDLFQKLLELQNAGDARKSPFKEIEIATSVVHMSLLSLLELSPKTQSPESFATLLKSRYSASEIATALTELETHGFIRRDPLTEPYQTCQKHIKKYDYNSNFFLKNFHAQCLELARSSLDTETPQERYLVSASFNINHKLFPRIVQINQQLIKMTRVPETENKRGLGVNCAERGLEESQNTVIG